MAEKGNFPNVYIYTYPEKKVFKTLKGGTEREFTSVTFNSEGTKMV